MRSAFLGVALFFVLSVSAYSTTVVTSTFILSSIVRSLGGNRVKVAYIIPPSAMPHVFSPTPRKLRVLLKANLFIGVGYGFEFWLKDISGMLKGKRIFLLSEVYRDPIDAVRSGNSVRANPHIWLDVVFMEKVGIPAIVRAMCSVDTKDCSFFKKNEVALLKKLRMVVREYHSFSKGLKGVCFVEVDPAFAYYLRSFGVKPCGSLLTRGGEEPTLKSVVGLKDRCKCKRGVVLYAFHGAVANTIGEMLGYKVVFLNPLGNPEDPRINTYVGLLRFSLMKLEKAVHDKP